MHIIEFRRDVTCDLKGRSSRLERLRMSAGERVHCRAVCKVIEGESGPVEAADIEIQEGILLNVPCRHFTFCDS